MFASGRRAFLSSLVFLPFVGGALQSTGRPSAVAIRVEAALLRRYQAFLARENLAVLAELQMLEGLAPRGFDLARPETYADRVPTCLVSPDGEAAALVVATPPSSRAALVIAAAGMKVGGAKL